MFLLNEPVITDKTREYVKDVLDSTWLSIEGKYVQKLEKKFAAWVGLRRVIGVNSGTSALQMSLAALNLPKGSCVAVPNYGCAAVIQALAFNELQPVLIDVEGATFGMSFELFEQACQHVHICAVILVHLYGTPARDTIKIFEHCKHHSIPLIGDCCEAHGVKVSLVSGGFRNVSCYGDLVVYSCRSDKIVGSCDAGLVCTNSDELATKVKCLANRGRPDDCDPFIERFKYDMPGAGNFLLNNLVAAVACASLEDVERQLEIRIRNANVYRKHSDDLKLYGEFQEMWGRSVGWLNVFVFNDRVEWVQIVEIAKTLTTLGIETRLGFYPFDKLRITKAHSFWLRPRAVSHWLWKHSLVFPSSVQLSVDNVCEIMSSFKRILKAYI